MSLLAFHGWNNFFGIIILLSEYSALSVPECVYMRLVAESRSISTVHVQALHLDNPVAQNMFSAEAAAAATMGRMRAASTSSSEQSAGAGAGGRTGKSLGGVPCSIVVKRSADGSLKIASVKRLKGGMRTPPRANATSSAFGGLLHLPAGVPPMLLVGAPGRTRPVVRIDRRRGLDAILGAAHHMSTAVRIPHPVHAPVYMYYSAPVHL